jgi:hypothetical protein
MRRLGLVLVVCGALLAPAPAHAQRARSKPLAHWARLATVPYALDLSTQRSDGRIMISSNPPPGEATGTPKHDVGPWSLVPGRAPAPFASSYLSPGGDETYMVMSPARPRRRCSFGDETLYVLRLAPPMGVTAIDRRGHVRQFATITGQGVETGIALDQTGHFGYRLIVTVSQGIWSALYAINCHGRVSLLAPQIPKVEGGLVVAPPSFGRFGGYLIGPDEFSGHIYGIPPDGGSEALATLGADGQDGGPESLGFVPRRFGRAWRVLVSDRAEPAAAAGEPGDGVILDITGASLLSAGVRAGDLLVVNEESALTFDVRCTNTCRSREVADGPVTAHVEGHIAFARWPQHRLRGSR